MATTPTMDEIITKVKQRMERLTAGTGKVYDEELCTWHNEYERGLRRVELLWVLTELEGKPDD